MTANKLEDSIRQYLKTSDTTATTPEDKWSLDADLETLRRALGVSFAGNDKVSMEPTLAFGLSHCMDVPLEERVHWIRYMMSFPLLDDFRQENHFHLCSTNSETGDITAFVNIQEYNTEAKEQKYFANLRHSFRFAMDNILLMTYYGESVPSIFKNPTLNKPFDGKLGNDFETKTQKWHGEVMPKGSHWYVHTVGVDPACQGQGKGKAIMEKLNALADQSNQIMYLEAGESNRKFYEKMGFTVMRSETIVNPEDSNEVFVMRLLTRQPKPGAEEKQSQ